MNIRSSLSIALGLAMASVAPTALAQQSPVQPPPGNGMSELSDPELGAMRGRYTLGSHTVAWFGVTMVSTWQTQAGQSMQSRMTLGLDISQRDRPRITFQPHVSITAADAPVPAPSGDRTIDHAGLANVNGMVQSVQIAGDGNRASNVARISLHEQGGTTTAAATPATGAEQVAMVHEQGMSAIASLQDSGARVLLQIDGQGAVEQWIGSSGMGQSIRLAADGHQASNWMELDVARGPAVPSSRASLGQNVAQAIALSRGIAVRY